jgi:NNP family nitrate/nitrite transporter-like MFS transporter
VVKRWSDYTAILKESDSGWFCFIYSLTFGGFVGLASYLSIFFRDQYGLTKVQAGDLTTIVVLFGSFLRPVGGLLSDRWGGYRLLLFLLTGISICLGAVATLPGVNLALLMLVLAMAMLGMGNGAVFQLVPQRFAGRVGIMTGIVGAAGGLGGFLLPSLLGAVKDRTGTFELGFALVAAAMLSGAAALLYLGRVWRESWSEESAIRAGLLADANAGVETVAAQ